MKTLASLLILFGFTTNYLHGQRYFPFPTENVNWNVYLSSSCDDMIPPVKSLLRYTLNGDTLINEIEYKKLCLESGDTSNPIIISVGSIREIDKKIYYVGEGVLGFPLEEEVLLYDFTKNIGDTIKHDSRGGLYSTVLDIDSVLIVDEYRKIYEVDNHWFYHNPDYIVEGIGSIENGLLGHISDIPTCGSHYWENICFKENGQVKYLNPSYESCFPNEFFVSIDVRDESYEIEIYPNPVSDKLLINNLNIENKLHLQVINYLGKTIFAKELHNGPNEISIPSYNAIYFVLVIDNNGKIIKKEKIIKQ